MAQPARSYEPVASPSTDPVTSLALPAAAQVIAVGDAAVEWSASPARALHEQLLQSFGTAAPVRDDRLPLRWRLVAIGGAVMAPWLAIGAAWSLLA